MKLAYIITAYASAEQLERLINTLDRPHHSFVIHIDARREEVFQETKALLKDRPNVHLLEKRYRIWWGRTEFARSILSAMAYLVDEKIDYDYSLLISEVDYPIKPIDEIEQFFEENAGKNFIDYALNDSKDHVWADWPPPASTKTRMEHWHLMVRSRLVLRIPMKRKLPLEHTAYVGWLWWNFTRECVEYFVDFTRNNPKYLKFYDHTFIPDEFIFQTIVMNSPFKDTVVNRNLRYRHPEPFPNHVEWVKASDMDALKASDALFVRKLSIDKTPELMEQIDREMLGLAEEGESASAKQA